VVCPRPFELRFMVPSIPAFSRFAAAFKMGCRSGP
jgi:hypothetical protein